MCQFKEEGRNKQKKRNRRENNFFLSPQYDGIFFYNIKLKNRGFSATNLILTFLSL